MSGLLKNHRTPSCFVPHTYNVSARPVDFHNCNDGVMRVARRLRVSTMHSRDILHQAKVGSSWSSQLRLDGSRSDQAGEAGPVELLQKKATLMKHILKRESWTTALSLTEERAKGSLQEKNTTDKKELLTLATHFRSS